MLWEVRYTRLGISFAAMEESNTDKIPGTQNYPIIPDRQYM